MSIQRGDWRAVVKEYDHLISHHFTSDTKEYVMFGLVHAEDGFYYGMIETDTSRIRLLSCVVDLAAHGYTIATLQ